MKPPAFICRSSKRRIRILTGKIRAWRLRPSCLARGKKGEALRQYEALANEAQKPALKAEAAVRGGLIATDLIQPEKGKIDKGMVEKATALFQKGKTYAGGGQVRAIAEVGLLRLQYLSGQYAQLWRSIRKSSRNFRRKRAPK